MKNEANDNLRVLLVSPIPPPMGGIATWSTGYLAQMKKKGISVKCINISHKYDRCERRTIQETIFQKVSLIAKIVIEYTRSLIRDNFDIIHINSSAGNGVVRDWILLIIAKFFDAKTVIHYHCNIQDQIDNKKMLEKVLIKGARLSTQVITLNDCSKKYLKNKRIEAIILPNSIAREEVARAHNNKELITTICFSGRVSFSKGCEQLITIANNHPQISFELVGLIDESFITNIKIPDNVYLRGKVPHSEVISLLDRTDIFLFLSRTEGFSMSLLEAMGRGVPCIVSDVGANKEMLLNEGGVVVDGNNVDEVERALIYMSDIDTRRDMSNWNIHRVNSKYTNEEVFNKLVMIYRGL